MYRFRSLVVAFLSLIALGPPASLFSAMPSTDSFLPSVGRGAGQNDSDWFTRMWIFNPGSEEASIQILFLPRNQSNPSPQLFTTTLAPGRVNRYNDPLNGMFQTSGFGAIRVISDQPVVVTSRIYSAPPEGEAHSVGQLFNAVPASFALSAGQRTFLVGVIEDGSGGESDYRFNYGLVETAGGTASITVTLTSQSGTFWNDTTVTLEPYEVRQWGISELLGERNAWNARLEVAVTSGDGRVIAFGSGLANQSNDPSTFEMVFE